MVVRCRRSCPKGRSVIVQAAWRQASLKPKHSNGMRTKLTQASGGPRRGLCEPASRVSGPRAENPCSSSRSQAQRTDNEAASRCPFASKTHCGSHATRARLPAAPTAALRSAGAAPLLLACGPARTSGGAAPRAGTPRAAHHEPGARAPEGVRMQRLIAVAASAVGRETRRRAVHNVASMACGVGQRRRMASRRRARGPHTSVTHAGARGSSASGSAASTRKAKKRPGPTT